MLRSGHLRNLFLDDNGMRAVEPGAFDAVSNLEHVWLGGNELNCSSVRGSLPSGAECIEEHCGVEVLSWVGDGVCHREFDPEYATAQCAWDGGDCDGEHGRGREPGQVQHGEGLDRGVEGSDPYRGDDVVERARGPREGARSPDRRVR